jgi:hypothetical protein
LRNKKNEKEKRYTQWVERGTMENCARIFKQFGFKHVLERS